MAAGRGRRIGPNLDFTDEVTEEFEPQNILDERGEYGQSALEMMNFESHDAGKSYNKDIITKFNKEISTEGVSSVGNFAQRPDFGFEGHQLQVIVNYFLMQFNEAQQMFHYDVLVQQGPKSERPPPGGDTAEEGDQASSIRSEVIGGETSAVIRRCLKQLVQDENWNDTLGTENKPFCYKFDGRRNLYVTRKLPMLDRESVTFEVTLRNGQVYSVRLKFVADLSLEQLKNYLESDEFIETPQKILQALEVVMSDNFLRMDKINRCYFWDNPDVQPQPLGSGFEVWFGFRQALRLCQDRLLLNIDMAHQAYIQADISVAQFIAQYMGSDFNDRRRYSREWHARFERYLPRLEVMWRGVRAKIASVTAKIPAEQPALDTDNFANYKEQYESQLLQGVELQCPKLPLMELKIYPGGNYRNQLGEHPLVPPEFLFICKGQRSIRPPGRTRRQFPEVVACSPPERMRRIQSNARKVLIGFDDMEKFGFRTLSDERPDQRTRSRKQAIKVNARVLPPPALVYGDKKTINPGNTGAWQQRDPVTDQPLKFSKPMKIEAWGIVSFIAKCDIDVEKTESTWGIKDFVKYLVQVLKSFGVEVDMTLKPPLVFADQIVGTGGNNSVMELMKSCKEEVVKRFERPPDIFLIALPVYDRHPYEEVKYYSLSRWGIPTQCFVASAAGIPVRKPNIDEYCRGVASKINCKLGGFNSHLAASERLIPLALGKQPYMFVGLDTSRTRTDPPQTVACMSASMDKFLSMFAVRISVQDHNQTAIQHLGPMLKELLYQFRDENRGKLPDRIVFFRDGISQGQFSDVIHEEHEAMQVVFSDIYVTKGTTKRPYNPHITYIVLQKAHNTRFFAQTAASAMESCNVYPGTVTDRRITDKHFWDFYLVSHQSSRGTARPVHYYVLLDQNRFSSDLIQLVTYWMCYNYCRSTKTTVAPIPTCYARLASRLGMKIQGYADQSSSSSGTGSGTGQGSGQVQRTGQGSGSGSGRAQERESGSESGTSSDIRSNKIHPDLNNKMWYA